ncbi:serine/threonine-protein phosphatase 6 regulatory ankyrin repeat subunit A-like [Physella acuta]|uniref:serine/threonine-protein phosphatase 6 regulatory ankyrin repeat subunit A-like n=1 Tax=Physella acuta TaxID=109671 RepID=UPI0027DC05B8|nr:serine/threonine-protein phosphatase 6 regulatory ankyrin repeat subunit A-like [Physella acuta]
MKEFNSFNVPDKILQPRLTQNRINKSLEILKILLAHEFDVNIRDNYRKTALHYSVEYEQLEFTHMLLEAGADVNLLDDNHDTPLVIACRLYLNLQKINELGDFGGSSLDISHYKGLMTSTKKMRSRLNYLAKMVESLITPDARVNIADKDGYTALHLAAETDNVQIVQRLLGAGGDVRVAANTGETVLHCAARSSCSEIMDILLSEPQSADAINARMTELFERSNKRLKRFHGHEQVYNSRVHQVDYLDHNNKRSQVCLNTLSGKTALIVALENSNEQTALKLLSRHPDLKVHTDEGYTALHFAAFESCTDVVRHMLQAGCNVNVQTEEGHTPLMLAGNKEIALLLCDAGADVNLVDKNGDKALHLAIYRSEADVAQVLINKGTVIDGNFPEPLPPLVLAAALNAITIVKMLLKAGANVNVLSSSGISPLMAAAACDSSGYNNAEIFQILNEHGADFNMTGKKGRTALMYLVKRGNPQLHLGTFLFYGADLNIEDDDNRSALTYHLLEDETNMSNNNRRKIVEEFVYHGNKISQSGVTDERDVPRLSKAVELDDVELVKNILHRGADVNKTDKNGRTCLHVAVSKMKEFNSFGIPDKILQPRLTQNRINKSLEILKILLAHELDVNICDNYRKTALHYSVEYEQLEFTNMLLEAGADVNLLDDDHETPLIIACRLYLNLQQKDELGDFSGSSLDISHYKGLMTSTKKMRSRLNYLAKMVDTLITPAARVNMADEDGYTALHLAAQTNNVQIIERLLGAGGDVRVAANTGETVLHCAARSSCSEIMDILLSEPQSADAINARMTELFERSNKRLKRFHGHEQVYNCRVHEVDYLDHNNKRSQPTGSNNNRGKIVEEFVYHGNKISQSGVTDERVSPLENQLKEKHQILTSRKRKRECEQLLQKGDVNAFLEGDVPLLSKAVELDDVELVKNILQRGADVNKTDKNGKTCLHIAVSKMKEFNRFNVPDKILQPRLTHYTINKSLEILEILLAHELDVNIRDNYRKTALHYSVEYEQLEFTNMLLEVGADVNLLDDNQETPLIIASRLYLNIHNMKSGVSREDISVYRGTVTSKVKLGSRLKYLAKIVASLITPAARVNIADKDGYTALHFVDQTDNVDLVERLLAAGGDVRDTANNKVTILHLAAKNGSCDIMDILLNDPHITDVINARMTTLHEKSTKRLKRHHVQERLGHSPEEKIYFLDRNDRRSQVCLNTLSGKTALMVALENSNEQTALKLLSRHPDLNIHTDEGYTALHFAAHGSCTHVVRHLLHAGYNINKQTEEGYTYLMLAGNKEIALMLCDAGADVNLVDKNGDKALHMAIYRSEADVAQVLINKGAVIDGNFPEPLPPLVLAAALNEIAIVKMLLKAGANVNVLSSYGISPLMAAAACISGGYNNSEIFQILHEHGADFNMTGKKGRTALMYLVKHGDMLAYLETLVSFGADLDVKDRDNKTALVYCLSHTQQFKYSETLLIAGANPIVGPEYRYLVVSFLPVNDWRKIPLCYDPVDYETLQRPRPLMYHWPMGINLVS